jgi:hypothetical protein
VVPVSDTRRPPGRAMWKWFFAAAVAATVVIISVWAVRSGNLDSPRKVAGANEPLPNKEAAFDLRQRAATECAGARWKACLDDLDLAKESDPEGDQASEVTLERQKAEHSLALETGASR